MNNRVRLLVELNLEGDWGQNSTDEDERKWFMEELLGDELLLFSPLVGDDIGTVRILQIYDASLIGHKVP